MTHAAGHLIRTWRHRRGVSQLELAHRAQVSARHVSFVETGRSRPTVEMVLRLCDHLTVPLREQNQVLLAAGHAPAHPEHPLGSPPMEQVSAAIDGILTAHLPYPALVVDRRWDLVAANDALYALLDGLPGHVLEPPVNVIRLSMAPDGLAPRIENLDQWRGHLVHRLRRELDVSADPDLEVLLSELGELPPSVAGEPLPLLVPLRLRVGDEVLSLVSTTTVFGTPHEVTLSELAIESFYPSDDTTRRFLLQGQPPSTGSPSSAGGTSVRR